MSQKKKNPVKIVGRGGGRQSPAAYLVWFCICVSSESPERSQLFPSTCLGSFAASSVAFIISHFNGDGIWCYIQPCSASLRDQGPIFVCTHAHVGTHSRTHKCTQLCNLYRLTLMGLFIIFTEMLLLHSMGYVRSLFSIL